MPYPCPFLLRNIPENKRDDVKSDLKDIKIKKLENELNFYKSIFKTHYNSAVYNLRIKTIQGEKVWIDRTNIVTDQLLLRKLDLDEEVIEWKIPVRCER